MKKEKKKRVRTVSGFDRHHIIYQRRHWNKGYAKALREHWYCVIPLPRRTLHQAIHENLCDIPVPNDELCRSAYFQITNLEKYGAIHETDPIELRLELLISCFDNGDSPTAEAFKKQLEIVRTYQPGK